MKKWEDITELSLGQRPSWDEYFMAQAIIISSRSSCLNVRAGAVLVNNKKRQVGGGYNGAPSMIESCYNIGSCAKKRKGLDYEESLNSGECVGVHAEMNAIGNMVIKSDEELTLYSTIFPCHTCAKNLLLHNITKIIFKGLYSSKEFDNTVEILNRANVKLSRLDLSLERFLSITLRNGVDFKFGVWSKEDKDRLKKFLEEKEC